jgi:protein SCO1/2
MLEQSPTVIASARARRGLIVFVAGLALILGAFAADRWWFGGGASGGFADVPIGGAFTLTDQHGALRHDTDFRGRLMLVYFGYTFCPDACPAALTTMTSAMDKLGAAAAKVQPIFITVDPERDSVAQMKLYAANFTPRLIALTGTPDQVAAAARAYRVFFEKVKGESASDYSVDHGAFVYMLGRDGRYLRHFAPDITADGMAAAIKAVL